MGEDSIEIDVSDYPRIVVAGFSLCFVADSTSTRGGVVFVGGTGFSFFELVANGIESL